jgi:hypothetical protein
MNMSKVKNIDHELFTKMLFTDAVIGVGFPALQVAVDAERGGLAIFVGNPHNLEFSWNRDKLEELSLSTLQDLYTGLKLHEATDAG